MCRATASGADRTRTGRFSWAIGEVTRCTGDVIAGRGCRQPTAGAASGGADRHRVRGPRAGHRSASGTGAGCPAGSSAPRVEPAEQVVAQAGRRRRRLPPSRPMCWKTRIAHSGSSICSSNPKRASLCPSQRRDAASSGLHCLHPGPGGLRRSAADRLGAGDRPASACRSNWSATAGRLAARKTCRFRPRRR